MAEFDYNTEAELFPSRNRKSKRQPFAYRRFAQAADAIRFAIEELPRDLLPETCLEVDEKIFNRDEIRRLYESGSYPLTRRATILYARGIKSINSPRVQGDTDEISPTP